MARRGQAKEADVASWKAEIEDSWTATEIHFYANRPTSTELAITSSDEGAQQELLGLWLMDNLTPTGVVHRPQTRQESGRSRELIDLLMFDSDSLFLFESKAVGLLSRNMAPTREKLAQATQKHVKKAIKQLAGAMRRINTRLPVFDRAGAPLELPEQVDIPHAVVLVADLSLLGNSRLFEEGQYGKLAAEVGAALHILDLTELLRAVQTAEILSEASRRRISKIDVFKDCLLQRAEIVAAQGRFNIEMILPAGASSAWQSEGRQPPARINEPEDSARPDATEN
jgi:hypothetical protein